MHYLYILYSKKLDRFYVGETSDIKARIQKHHSKHYKQAFTGKADDWELVLQTEILSKEDAIFLEKFIKRMKSKKFIRKIVDNPGILKDILEKK
jgi:putative endonuclease